MPSKSKFVRADQLKQIDLGDGDWAKIPERFSYGLVQKLTKLIGNPDDEKTEHDDTEVVLLVIKEWNLKQEGSETVEPITLDNIRLLDIVVVKKILEVVTKLVAGTNPKG